MNLKSLSNASMISLSAYWLGDAAAQRALQGHFLGAAMNRQIALAHDVLAELDARRRHGQSALERKNQDIAELAHTHHRKARALHCYLSGLIAGSDDASLADWAQGLLDLLFPDGLAVINRSYVDAAGWAHTVSCQVDADALARMGSVSVGEHSLAEVYQAWIAAGVALGQRVHERAQLQASLGTTSAAGAELSAGKVRSLWIRTVRALLLTIDLMKLSPGDRDALLAPLRKCIHSATRPGQPDDSAGNAPGAGSDIAEDVDVAADSIAEDVEMAADSIAEDVDMGASLDAAAPAARHVVVAAGADRAPGTTGPAWGMTAGEEEPARVEGSPRSSTGTW